MATITERVAAGAAFLDEHDPGWWRGDGERPISLDRLDLEEAQDCILGQRCPVAVLASFCYLSPHDSDELSSQWWRAYTAYAVELSGLSPADPALGRWGDEHGFSSPAEDYPDLTAAWKGVITGRRLAS
jgi:hypothetical protein